jgi:hypothetical protein
MREYVCPVGIRLSALLAEVAAAPANFYPIAAHLGAAPVRAPTALM